MSEQKALGRTVVGEVISIKMDKTIVVRVAHKEKHPIYGKFVRRISKMYAHDEKNQCVSGDHVLIQQSRPLSKIKHWVLLEILQHAERDVVDSIA